MQLQPAYSYIRFSKGDQKAGDSLRRQTEGTRAYCAKNRLELVESYEDLGVSSWKGRNAAEGALSAFLDLVKASRIATGSALVIEELDRLSRQSPRATLAMIMGLLDRGIDVHMTSSGHVFRAAAESSQQAMDMMMAIALALKANEHSESNSRRLSAANANKRSRAAAGEKVTVSKSLPWWLTWENGAIVAPDERVAVLKSIFELTAQGVASARIARLFNSEPEKYPTFRPGAIWHDNRVRLSVRSDAPLGTLEATAKTAARGRGYSIPNYYPATISKALATKARAMLEKNATHAAGRPTKGTRPVNIFRQLLRWDGVPMRHSTHQNGAPDKSGVKAFHGYYEAFAANGKQLACIPATQLEPLVITALDELTNADLKPVEPARQLLAPRAKARLETVKNRHANLLKLAEEGGNAVKGIITRLSELETEITSAEEELQRAERLDGQASTTARVPHQEIRAAKLNLKDNPTRERLGYALRRLIDRIDVAHDPLQLPIGAVAKINFATKLNAREVAVIDDPIEPPKRRKPIAALVTFATGAARLIARLPAEDDDRYPNSIFSIRLDPKNNPAAKPKIFW